MSGPTPEEKEKFKHYSALGNAVGPYAHSFADNVNKPAHYNSGRIEVLEFIEDKNLPHHLACVVKYICRAGLKNPETEIQDLDKAGWYLQRWIELRKGIAGKPNEMRK